MPTKKKRVMITLEVNIYGQNYLDLCMQLAGKKQTIDVVNSALYYYYEYLLSQRKS